MWLTVIETAGILIRCVQMAPAVGRRKSRSEEWEIHGSRPTAAAQCRAATHPHTTCMSVNRHTSRIGRPDHKRWFTAAGGLCWHRGPPTLAEQEAKTGDRWMDGMGRRRGGETGATGVAPSQNLLLLQPQNKTLRARNKITLLTSRKCIQRYISGSSVKAALYKRQT